MENIFAPYSLNKVLLNIWEMGEDLAIGV